MSESSSESSGLPSSNVEDTAPASNGKKKQRSISKKLGQRLLNPTKELKSVVAKYGTMPKQEKIEKGEKGEKGERSEKSEKDEKTTERSKSDDERKKEGEATRSSSKPPFMEIFTQRNTSTESTQAKPSHVFISPRKSPRNLVRNENPRIFSTPRSPTREKPDNFDRKFQLCEQLILQLWGKHSWTVSSLNFLLNIFGRSKMMGFIVVLITLLPISRTIWFLLFEWSLSFTFLFFCALAGGLYFRSRKGQSIGVTSSRRAPEVTTTLIDKGNNSLIDPSKCYATGKGIEEKPGKVGEELTFTVYLATSSGVAWPLSLKEYFQHHPTLEDLGGCRVQIEGKATLIPSMVENGDGTLTITYTARKTGKYDINITFGGQSIQKSPFKVQITSGDIDSRHCVMRGTGVGGAPVSVEEEVFINVETFDCFGHKRKHGGFSEGFSLFLKEIGTNVETKMEFSIQDRTDGTYIITYKPRRTGVYTPLLYHNNSIIPNDSVLLVLSEKDMQQVMDNVTKKRVFFKAKLLNSNIDAQAPAMTTGPFMSNSDFVPLMEESKKTKDVLSDEEKDKDQTRVWILLTPKQICINSSYMFGLFARRLYTLRVRPSLVIQLVSSGSPTTSTPALKENQEKKFLIDLHQQHGMARQLVLTSKKRDIFYGTYLHFLYSKIGKSNVFQDKLAFFNEEMRKIHAKSKVSTAPTIVKIDRGTLLETSFQKLNKLNTAQWRGLLYIHFEGEAGIDGGGLTREYFSILAREIFHPKNGLFCKFSEEQQVVHPAPPRRFYQKTNIAVTSAATNKFLNVDRFTKKRHKRTTSDLSPNVNTETPTPQPPNQASWLSRIDMDSASVARLVGKILAKCIYDSSARDQTLLVGVHLTQAFYKLLLYLPVDYEDFATADPQFYCSKVKYILENNIDELSLGLTFSEEVFDPVDNSFVRTVDLKPNGRNIEVTEENKNEYLAFMAEFRLYERVKTEVEALREGFYSLIPADLISMFDENDLELLVCGLPTIDIHDFKANINYAGGYNVSSKVISWFWVAVENFTQEERARLLQFITGSSQLPLEGFSALNPMITITKSLSPPGSFPHAHTCFNQLDLPDYKSFQQLQESLISTITHFNEGFGIS